jgi:nucleoid-associated protein YgaU
MRYPPLFLPVLAAGAVVCGCTTVDGDRQAQAARTQTELVNMKRDLARLGERLEAVAAAQQDLYRQIDRLREESQGAAQEADRRLAAMETAVGAARADRASLRREIAADLSSKMAELLRAQGAQGGRRGTPVQSGYEHTVGPGQTLSEIAAEYKVTVDAVVKANNLRDPNAIRVGQTLFIPE